MVLCSLALLLLQACSGGGGGGAYSSAVSRIVVSESTIRLGAEMTTQLSATALNKSGNALPNVSFEWQSSDAAVASVNASGLVTGVAPGQA
ncbi:MAG TPA: Ig-like domain-containing protein, partial [Steroidobacter sp.]|nr:Ig-like domain-containing protein [Steroidobacter sp.]